MFSSEITFIPCLSMSFWNQLLELLKTQQVEDDEPERTVMDYKRPLFQQFEVIQALAAQEGRDVDEMIIEILQSGIETKEAVNLSAALLNELTNRELEVTALICHGMNTAQIAKQLVITPATTRTHIRHILSKLRVRHPDQVRDLLNWWDYSEWIS